MDEIYNERMERIDSPDLKLVWLEETERSVAHEAVRAVPERWHYETAAEYENGGRDVVNVVDVPGIPAREAWEERVPIQIYHPYTQAQLEKIGAEKNRPTQEQRLQRVEEAMSRMTAALAQLQTDVSAAMAWMMQKEA